MDLPFRILVGVIVVGLTAPTVMTGLSAYESQQSSVRALRAIDAIVRVAQQFHVSGGGAERVRVDLSGGLAVRVEYISIGDAAGGPMATTARYAVSGLAEAFVITDPPVPMEGEGGPLRLDSGHHLVDVSYDGEGAVRLAVVG